jgi:hypothetical protein
MNYEIHINGSLDPEGTISLLRIALIAEGIRKISEGALQIRLKGLSISRGRKMMSLDEALTIRLIGLKKGSTCLELEAKTFAETLKPIQLDIFRQEAQADLPNLTPVSLFMNAFKEAVKDNPSSDLLDKPLLNELKRFKKALLSDEEEMVFTNRGTIESLTLNKETFTKVKVLEKELPDPQSVIINGKVDLLKFSNQKVTIQTAEGMVDGFLGEGIATEEIGNYWGKEITISGKAHYKPGGKPVIEIERIFSPSDKDSYFSKRPKSETIEQQIERQLREGKKPNSLADVVGKWPGDETDEEFEELLKMLSK